MGSSDTSALTSFITLEGQRVGGGEGGGYKGSATTVLYLSSINSKTNVQHVSGVTSECGL